MCHEAHAQQWRSTFSTVLTVFFFFCFLFFLPSIIHWNFQALCLIRTPHHYPSLSVRFLTKALSEVYNLWRLARGLQYDVIFRKEIRRLYLQFGDKTRYVIALELRQTTAKSTKAYEQYENFTIFFRAYAILHTRPKGCWERKSWIWTFLKSTSV